MACAEFQQESTIGMPPRLGTTSPNLGQGFLEAPVLAGSSLPGGR